MSLMDTLRRRSSGNSQSGSGSRFQQLAPGVRMDTVTLEQALSVAEVRPLEPCLHPESITPPQSAARIPVCSCLEPPLPLG